MFHFITMWNYIQYHLITFQKLFRYNKIEKKRTQYHFNIAERTEGTASFGNFLKPWKHISPYIILFLQNQIKIYKKIFWPKAIDSSAGTWSTVLQRCTKKLEVLFSFYIYSWSHVDLSLYCSPCIDI